MNIFDIMFFFFKFFPFFSEVNIKRILLARIYLLVENAVSKIIIKFTVTHNSFCLEMRWQDYTK